MVEDIISKYAPVTQELRSLKEVKFFAVVRMDELTDRWSLLFGLIGADDLDKREAVFSKVREIVLKHLKGEDMQNVARIGLFPTRDHLIKDLMKFSENEKIDNVKANGNFIHQGYILISKVKTARTS